MQQINPRLANLTVTAVMYALRGRADMQVRQALSCLDMQQSTKQTLKLQLVLPMQKSGVTVTSLCTLLTALLEAFRPGSTNHMRTHSPESCKKMIKRLYADLKRRQVVQQHSSASKGMSHQLVMPVECAIVPAGTVWQACELRLVQ